MSFSISKADRKNVKLRIGFWGASGSGKTYSALRFAHGFIGDWDKIAVLDTENGSAELYSHLGEFNHVPLSSPFSPGRYVEAIKFIESQKDIELIIIDSISHEWEADGGCLELQTTFGGRYQDWAKVTPLHNKFVQAITHSRCHVIVTARAKIDYDISKDDKNKTKIEKVGMKNITREGFDYDMTMGFKINQAHYAEIDKDRTDIFKNEIPFIVNEQTGEKVRKWNDSGKTLTFNKIVSCLKDLTKNFTDMNIVDSLRNKFGNAKEIAAKSEFEQLVILDELKLILKENNTTAV